MTALFDKCFCDLFDYAAGDFIVPGNDDRHLLARRFGVIATLFDGEAAFLQVLDDFSVARLPKENHVALYLY